MPKFKRKPAEQAQKEDKPVSFTTPVEVPQEAMSDSSTVPAQPDLDSQVEAMLANNPEELAEVLKSQPDLVEQVQAKLGAQEDGEGLGEGLVKLLESQPGLVEQIGAMLQANPGALKGLAIAQPELVEQVVKPGKDTAVRRLAMARFAKLPPAARKRAVQAFDSANEQGVDDAEEVADMVGGSAPKNRADARAAAKKKNKARAARKSARRNRAR